MPIFRHQSCLMPMRHPVARSGFTRSRYPKVKKRPNQLNQLIRLFCLVGCEWLEHSTYGLRE